MRAKALSSERLMSLIEKAKQLVEYRKKLIQLIAQHEDAIANEEDSLFKKDVNELNYQYLTLSDKPTASRIVSSIHGDREDYYDGD
jgi:hypothetical protein